MPLTLKPGTRVFSAVDSAEFIAVKAPSDPIDLTIGGAPAVLSSDERSDGGAAAAGHDGGAAMGKRYVDAAETLELLCTKAGPGVPALAGEVLGLKQAKPLPASD